MNKALKIFWTVTYFALVIVIGIVLAIVLPNLYTYSMPMDFLQDSLNNGNYSDAMRLIGGYYNSEYVYLDEENNIVIFETLILEENSEGVEYSVISKAYSGFIYNVKGKYDVKSEVDNRTSLLVTSLDEKTYSYTLLNYDSDLNDINDSIVTLEENNFIYFGITDKMISSINKITFIDKDGKAFISFDNLNFDFNTDFFNKSNDFIEEYNKDPYSDNLESLDETFRLNENYKKSYFEDIYKKAIRKSCIIVVVYFILAYMLGDILVGKRYIIKFVKRIIKKFKKGKPVEEKSSFNEDYFTMVTFKLNVEKECDSAFTISYSNEQGNVEFILNKENNYTQAKRIHAGTYYNPWFTGSGYIALNLPSELTIKGFTKSYEIDLIKDNKNK